MNSCDKRNRADNAVPTPFPWAKYSIQRWQQILTCLNASPGNGIIGFAKKQYECGQCQRRFVHLAGLERHKKKFHLEGSDEEEVEYAAAVIKCTDCAAVFANVDQYERHSKLFNWESLIFSSASEDHKRNATIFQENQRVVAINMAYLCEYCDTLFSEPDSLFDHESLHDPADGFSCNFCSLNLPTLDGILAHRISKPEHLKREYDGRIANIPNVYLCNMCHTQFRLLSELQEHRHSANHCFPRASTRGTGSPTKEGYLLVHCATCGYLSNTASQFQQHLKEHQPKAAVGATSTNRAPDAHTQLDGEENSLGLRPYLCDQCGKTYTQSSHLWQHLRFHNGIRPFECPRPGCGRCFTIRPDLNDHIRKCHTGERPYVCETCGKRFLTGSVYYQHRLIHRGERRYGCNDCDKRFYRADALKNHQRIHTGEKPYSCHMCDRKFRQRGDREKHLRVKHMKVL